MDHCKGGLDTYVHTYTMQQALTPRHNDGDECARKNSALLSTLKSGVHLAFRPISASV